MVKLLMFPVNMEVGSVIALVLVNSTIALALLASTYPDVLLGDEPDKVSLKAPSVRFPLVKVKVPGIVKSPPKLTPPAPFKVKFLRELLVKRPEGKVIPLVLVNCTTALPLEALIVPLVLVGALFEAKVRVLAPTEIVPAVNVKVPTTVLLLPKEIPAPLIVKLLILPLNKDEGNKTIEPLVKANVEEA